MAGMVGDDHRSYSPEPVASPKGVMNELTEMGEQVDVSFLHEAIQKRNALVQEMLHQNDISIPEEVILSPSPHGYNALHLSASEGLTEFTIYLMKQVSTSTRTAHPPVV